MSVAKLTLTAHGRPAGSAGKDSGSRITRSRWGAGVGLEGGLDPVAHLLDAESDSIGIGTDPGACRRVLDLLAPLRLRYRVPDLEAVEELQKVILIDGQVLGPALACLGHGTCHAAEGLD